MSEPEKNTSNTEAGAGTAKKKSSKKLIIIILAIVLLGGAGGGVYYWRAASVSAAESADSEHEENHDEESSEESSDEKASEHSEKPAKKSGKSAATESLKASLPDDDEVKHIIELQPFVVNLADSDQARYLRLTVNLGVGGEGGGHKKPDPLFVTRMRNAILAVLSVKSSEDVLNAEGKAKLRKELLKAAQAADEESHVEAVYITDFIVQL